MMFSLLTLTESQPRRILLLVSYNLTHLSGGEEVASFDCLKDEGVEVRLSWEMGLWQRLFHLLDLYQTQRPLLPWTTHQTCQVWDMSVHSHAITSITYYIYTYILQFLKDETIMWLHVLQYCPEELCYSSNRLQVADKVVVYRKSY